MKDVLNGSKREWDRGQNLTAEAPEQPKITPLSSLEAKLTREFRQP